MQVIIQGIKKNELQTSDYIYSDINQNPIFPKAVWFL